MSHDHLNKSHFLTSHHDVIVVGAGFAGSIRSTSSVTS
jgi:monoamine oxidase